MIVIRDATPDDALAVAEVHVRSWQAAYRGLLPGAYLDALRPADRAARYTFGETAPDRPRTIIGTVGGRVAGFATIGPCRNEDAADAGELWALYADPDFWSAGVGRDLIVAARAGLAERGHTYGVLWVLAGNTRAEAFYRADGWEPDGAESTFEVAGVVAPELRYRRPSLG